MKQKTENTSNYHHGNLRESLIAEGLRVLEITENTDFSLRELTRSVGVSANAIYRHFANKDELLTALAIEGFRQLINMQGNALQDSTSKTPNMTTSFLAGGKAYITFARQHPTLFRLMYGRLSSVTQDQNIQMASQNAYNAMRLSLATVLNRAVDDPQIMVSALHAWSVIHGLSHLIIDGQVNGNTEDLDGLVDAIMHQAIALFNLQQV